MLGFVQRRIVVLAVQYARDKVGSATGMCTYEKVNLVWAGNSNCNMQVVLCKHMLPRLHTWNLEKNTGATP